MAKILVALDGDSVFYKNFIHLAKGLLGEINHHLFTGILVEDFSYTHPVKDLAINTIGDNKHADGRFLNDEDHLLTEVISNFESIAKDTNIRYEILNDFKLTMQEVVKQTIYADMLIMSYSIFKNRAPGKPENTHLYELLKKSKCPVLILPRDTTTIENLIFTYDNKESSVFAIRSFGNLFSGNVKDKEVSVLSVTPDAEDEVKNEQLLLNLVKQHYDNVGVQLLEGNNISKEINNFASGVPNPLIVMGAYGRSRISNLLIPSAAQYLLQNSSLPLFIAHR